MRPIFVKWHKNSIITIRKHVQKENNLQLAVPKFREIHSTYPSLYSELLLIMSETVCIDYYMGSLVGFTGLHY